MVISLKAARVNANLTQKEAANRIGVAKDTIRNWERGKHYPPADKLEIMLNVYDVKYDDLIFLPSYNA